MKNTHNKDIGSLETSANTVFVGSYASRNPPTADFINSGNVIRHWSL